jgi:hypothetical protein
MTPPVKKLAAPPMVSRERWASAAEVRRNLLRGELRSTRRGLAKLVSELGAEVESSHELDPMRLRTQAREIALLALRVRDLAHEWGTATEILTDP